VRFSFIQVEKANYPLRVLCRVLQVSRSGFYAWFKRAPSERERRDEVLKPKVLQASKVGRGVYGSPRIHSELKAQGVEVARKRVARLMKNLGIVATPPRRFRRTTDSNHDQPVAPNLLDRSFVASGPDHRWVADITYIWTWEGWLYLAVVVDLFSRRVVGWSMANHMRTDLVLEALGMALRHRLPESDLLHHSDRGSQYASDRYQEMLEEHGIECSMSRKGDCWDNAVVESFFGTLKTELIYRRPWSTRREARSAISEYIEVFYNRIRRHSYLGNRSPAEYERLAEEEMAKAA